MILSNLIFTYSRLFHLQKYTFSWVLESFKMFFVSICLLALVYNHIDRRTYYVTNLHHPNSPPPNSHFWQNHTEKVISNRQREVLNLYLDGYPRKLTAKNWAKRVKVSLDTASRDIKDLVEKEVLVPQQGRVRDVFYGIQCSGSVLVIPKPKAE